MGLRERLRQDLPPALKARDIVAARALRSAISAIENAEAVDAAALRPAGGAIAGAVLGLGAGDVARRVLSEPQVVGIVRGEISARATAAAQYDSLGRGKEAADLRAEAAVLLSVLNQVPSLNGS
jgi:uncharacterized protein